MLLAKVYHNDLTAQASSGKFRPLNGEATFQDSWLCGKNQSSALSPKADVFLPNSSKAVLVNTCSMKARSWNQWPLQASKNLVKKLAKQTCSAIVPVQWPTKIRCRPVSQTPRQTSRFTSGCQGFFPPKHKSPPNVPKTHETQLKAQENIQTFPENWTELQQLI